jgi:ketosteroid isomerase-like protein
MRTKLRVAGACALALAGQLTAADQLRAQTTAELDAYWAEVSRTVETGDFEAYAALYHADAVIVSNFTTDSHPIENALEGWEQGFIDTKAGRTKASVSFRFSQRLNDGVTAHETGIFNYRFEAASGQVTDQYVHFEGLLVKKDGWKMMMEYQKSPASVEEWNALR